MEWSGKLYSEKSSPPMVGSTISTFSCPNPFFHAATRRFVSSGLLYVAGVNWSFETVTMGARLAGTPPAAAIPFAMRSIADLGQSRTWRQQVRTADDVFTLLP